MKKILIVVAHPDDESIGPAGTTAYYAKQGVEIHLVCVTNGDAGSAEVLDVEAKKKLAALRLLELQKATKILGIAEVDMFGYPDGYLCNALYHEIADKLIQKIEDFAPQVIIVNERLGISGHLDHIAVSMITTFAFLKCPQVNKLYYVCLPKELRSQRPFDNYFVYFPEGYSQDQITTRISYGEFIEHKIEALRQHVSQIGNPEEMIKRISSFPKIDHYILHLHRNADIHLPETDLFAGIPEEQISIRRMRKKDILEMAKVFGPLGRTELEYVTYFQQQEKEENQVLLAFDDQKQITGYLIVLWKSRLSPHDQTNIPELMDIFVLPAQRHKGVASALIQHAERLALQKGIPAVGLGVRKTPEYAPSHRLFLELGFKEIGETLLPEGKITVLEKPLTASPFDQA